MRNFLRLVSEIMNIKILKRRIPFNIFRIIRFASLSNKNKNEMSEPKDKIFNIKKTGN